jgi:soluble lytic murein transglycosylase-like protein
MIAALGASLSVIGLSVAAFPAAAQVIEMQPDGTIVTHSGPAISTPEGTYSMLPPASSQLATIRDVPSTPVTRAIRETANNYALSNQLIEAVAWQESRMNQDAVSPKGARGVMQLMPATAESLGVDPNDLADNIKGGTAYLSQLLARYDGDLMRALAAYNAGPAAVERHNGVPPFPETQAFVASILDRLAAMTPAHSELQP